MRVGDRVLAANGVVYGPSRVSFRDLFFVFEGLPDQSIEVTWQHPGEAVRKDRLVLRLEDPGNALVFRSARVLKREGKNFGYVHLWGMSAETALASVDLLLDRQQIARSRADLAGWDELDGLLLDVRANSGGYDPNILPTFLRGQWNAGDFYALSRGGRRLVPPTYKPLPVVLLVNSGTASRGGGAGVEVSRAPDRRHRRRDDCGHGERRSRGRGALRRLDPLDDARGDRGARRPELRGPGCRARRRRRGSPRRRAMAAKTRSSRPRSGRSRRLRYPPLTEKWRSTTVLCVHGKVAMACDGQVTLGTTVMKQTAAKMRRLRGRGPGRLRRLAADAFALFSRFEAKLEEYRGNLERAASSSPRTGARTSYLRQLQAIIIVADKRLRLLSPAGDLISPDDGMLAIGSGGPYALAAARALSPQHRPDMTARQIAEDRSHRRQICIFTNDHLTLEEL